MAIALQGGFIGCVLAASVSAARAHDLPNCRIHREVRTTANAARGGPNNAATGTIGGAGPVSSRRARLGSRSATPRPQAGILQARPSRDRDPCAGEVRMGARPQFISPDAGVRGRMTEPHLWRRCAAARQKPSCRRYFELIIHHPALGVGSTGEGLNA